jgi:hypothetical protein
LPIKVEAATNKFSSLIFSTDLKFPGALSRSNVGVPAPSVILPVYSFLHAHIFSYLLRKFSGAYN